jgi:hypothetical protein
LTNWYNIMKSFRRNCKLATMYILKNKDGALSFSKKLLLAYHLFVCEPCRTFSKQNDLIDKFTKEIANDFEKSNNNYK